MVQFEFKEEFEFNGRILDDVILNGADFQA
jgi:hypothetical protein